MFKYLLCTCLLAMGVCLEVDCISQSFCQESPQNKNYFTYVLTNTLRPPYFNHTAMLVLERDSPFVFYMEKAIDICSNFTGMTTRYYANIGLFVTSLNGVGATNPSDKSYWTVINKYGKPSQLGVSNFIPQHKDVYTMKFTQ